MADLDFLDEQQSLDREAMTTLQTKMKLLTDVRERISNVETELAGLKKMERKISREDVPGFLNQYGISSLKLANGKTVEIKEDLQLSVPKTDPAKRRTVMQFLRQNGGGGLIKDTLTMEDPTVSVLEKLDKEEVAYKRSQDVNVSSLKAFARGLLGLKKNTMASKDIGDFPKEINLFVYSETKIK